ncbi:MAG: hypothetical protein H7A25_15425 [Leptospiraceae bacterium]|nr:hypothetical protein [Leptospiraceae bacterium]MCP5501290.1 hypothetical protein [Leptospiraceae bacterium]
MRDVDLLKQDMNRDYQKLVELLQKQESSINELIAEGMEEAFEHYQTENQTSHED